MLKRLIAGTLAGTLAGIILLFCVGCGSAEDNAAEFKIIYGDDAAVTVSAVETSADIVFEVAAAPESETAAALVPETTAAPVPETTAAPVPETTTAPEPETAAPEPETAAAPVPETTAAPAINTQLLIYPTSVHRNEYAAVKIQGAPNTEYLLTVQYKSGLSEADGLGAKISDAGGAVEWTWKIGGRTSLDFDPIVRVYRGGELLFEFTFDVLESQ